MGCHLYMDGHPHEHYAWKLNQLGAERYGELVKQFNTTQKKTKAFMEDRMEAVTEMLDAAERVG